MYIKKTYSKDKKYVYLQIVESYRDGKKVRQRVLGTLGREDTLMENKKLDGLIEKLCRYSEKLKVLDTSKECFENAQEYGTVLAIQKMWKELGMEKICKHVDKNYNNEYDFEKAVKLMVTNRLIKPLSKLALNKWKRKMASKEFEDIELQHVYRAMDILEKEKEKIEEEILDKSRTLFSRTINIVFYDLTTIYFETQKKSELKQYGYSKDNKTDRVQIVLGLLMGEDGLPIGYEIFEGNKFEGKTVINVVKALSERFSLKQIIFVGDKGILSKKTIELLEKEDYDYILSAKLKGLSNKNTQEILNDDVLRAIKEKKEVYETKFGNKRLILSYTKKRADRDKKQREILVEKLKKKLKNKKGAKNLMKPAYNKYIKVKKEEVFLNEEAILKDSKFDGIYGIYTNNKDLDKQSVIKAYHSLWHIEDAFRSMKGTLMIRPVYHYADRRIRGHVIMCFIAFYVECAMIKKLRIKGINESFEKVMDSLEDIKKIEFKCNGEKFSGRTKIEGLNTKVFRALRMRIPSVAQKI